MSEVLSLAGFMYERLMFDLQRPAPRRCVIALAYPQVPTKEGCTCPGSPPNPMKTSGRSRAMSAWRDKSNRASARRRGHAAHTR